MVELIEGKRGTEGKQLEEVKMELINEGLNEIWKEKETEISSNQTSRGRKQNRINCESVNSELCIRL